MEKSIIAKLDTSSENLFSVMSDVTVYSAWMDLVKKAEPASPVDGDPGPAWVVTLSAKVGPFSRSKRLRMVEEISSSPSRFRLSRSEVDGRDHAAWVLDSTITETDGGCRLNMVLSYDGDLWSGILDAVLSAQIDRSRRRLVRYVHKRF